LDTQTNIIPMVSRVIQIYDVIDAVKDNANFKDTRKYEYYHFVNVLNYKKVKLERNLQTLKKATADNFDDSMGKVEETLNEISLFLKQFRQNFF
jgi:hypothetical protein